MKRLLARKFPHGFLLLPRSMAAARRLGPGLITGAADDDPSGIATYSGRLAMALWPGGMLLLTTPLMIGIRCFQHALAGPRAGLAANMRQLCPRWLTLSLIGLLVVANTINIAADIGAMAEATRLIAGGPTMLYSLLFGALACWPRFFSYERSVRLLKWLTLSLLAYFAVVMVVHVPLKQMALESLRPWQFLPVHASLRDYAAMMVAVLGTTISPYLFFWRLRRKWKTCACDPMPQRCAASPPMCRSIWPASAWTPPWACCCPTAWR